MKNMNAVAAAYELADKQTEAFRRARRKSPEASAPASTDHDAPCQGAAAPVDASGAGGERLPRR